MICLAMHFTPDSTFLCAIRNVFSQKDPCTPETLVFSFKITLVIVVFFYKIESS